MHVTLLSYHMPDPRPHNPGKMGTLSCASATGEGEIWLDVLYRLSQLKCFGGRMLTSRHIDMAMLLKKLQQIIPRVLLHLNHTAWANAPMHVFS